MRPNRKNDWILTEVELALCANLLGNPEWNYIPVFEQQEDSLAQRMLHGTLHMIQMGLLIPAPKERFQPSQMLLERMSCVIWPERVTQLVGRGMPQWYFFRKGTDLVLVEPTKTEQDGYRVMVAHETEAELLWDCLREPMESPEETSADDAVLDALTHGVRALVAVSENGKDAVRVIRVLEQAGQLWLEEPEQTRKALSQMALARWLEGAESRE